MHSVYHWMNHHVYVCCNNKCPYLLQKGYAWRELDFSGNTLTTANKFNPDGTPKVIYQGLVPKIPVGMTLKGGKFFPRQIVNKYF